MPSQHETTKVWQCLLLMKSRPGLINWCAFLQFPSVCAAVSFFVWITSILSSTSFWLVFFHLWLCFCNGLRLRFRLHFCKRLRLRFCKRLCLCFCKGFWLGRNIPRPCFWQPQEEFNWRRGIFQRTATKNNRNNFFGNLAKYSLFLFLSISGFWTWSS